MLNQRNTEVIFFFKKRKIILDTGLKMWEGMNSKENDKHVKKFR